MIVSVFSLASVKINQANSRCGLFNHQGHDMDDVTDAAGDRSDAGRGDDRRGSHECDRGKYYPRNLSQNPQTIQVLQLD